MAKKRFRNAMSGYNKDEVNKYIDNMMEQYEAKIAEKEATIEELSKKAAELQLAYDELKSKEDALVKEKAGITKALIKANEMSDQIIKEAKEQAIKEVGELEVRAEEEREKIVDIKRQLAALQASAAKLLEKFVENLDKTIGSDEK
ncbi:MAG: Cell cycle protein GpsB [Firmicutes bacterium ADurb.Bin099]|jgi:cell division initiation protein|nr:MAG: Cell cycle protein GpsB [Firmicutes bacterium ADurb.Bin099]HPY98208.1 DivIVA domain-containing protein [Clostridia bacterium]HQC67758.1 DivIVA domain-containing protein [Clostridia bacterium]